RWYATLRFTDLHGDQLVVVPVVELTTVATPHGMDAATRRDQHATPRLRVGVEIDFLLPGGVGGVRDPVSVRRDARRRLAGRRGDVRSRRRSVRRLHEDVVALGARLLGDE